MDSSDPYCWPDSDCLRNKLNIYDGEELLTGDLWTASALAFSAG